MAKKKAVDKKAAVNEKVPATERAAGKRTSFSGSFSLDLKRVLNNPGVMVIEELDVALGRLRSESVERISQLRDGHTKDTHIFVKY